MPTPPAATTPRSARGSARLRRRVGTRHGMGVAAVSAGRVSRSRETSERAAFGARGNRTRDATISAALPAPTRPTGAGEIENSRRCPAIDPRRCGTWLLPSLRGVGGASSSRTTQVTAGWGASSRASGAPMISARTAARCSRGRRYASRRRLPTSVARHPSRHRRAFSPTRLFVPLRPPAALAPPRPARAYRTVVERGSERHAPFSLRRSRPLTFASRRSRTQPRVLGVIPARYNSRRFAGKPLALLGGKPLVMHVYRNACKAKCLDACVVATDDDRIAKAVRDNGGEVIMTDAACETSLERCLEVVRRLRRRG